MSGSNPKVSVVAAVYNCKPYVGDTIESVLAQTFRDWELILVDDRSTDGTCELLEEYARKDPRIRVFRMPRNSRQTICLNVGISKSRGEYIARIDGDDLMLPPRLEEQVRFLDEHPDYGVVGSFVETMDEGGTPICTYKMKTGTAELKECLKRLDPFYHPAVMLRREALFRAGLYNPRYFYAQDFDLWIRMARQCEVANLPAVLTRYRILSTSISRHTVRAQATEAFMILLDAVIKGYHPPQALAYLWKPIVYMLSPKWLIDRRFRYRDRRDRESREFVLGA